MRNARRAVLAVFAALVALVLVATPSLAASGTWGYTMNTTNPAAYQTNLLYSGSDFNPTAGTPSTGSITQITYSWAMLDPVPSGTTLQMYLCAGSGTSACLLVSNPSVSASSGSGTTTAFAGYAATSTFHYVLRFAASTTYVFPQTRYSKQYYVQVYYNY